MQPLPSAPSIRRATVADAAALADIGRRTYSDTFAELSAPDDLNAFLNATYSTELQARELSDPALTYFVVESGNHVVAFALIRRNSVSQFVDDPSAIELQRFYVDRSCHGTGVAHQLMTACVDYAASYGAGTRFLGVFEQTARAIRFYGKHGFRTVGNQLFRVGTDDQRDLVMARAIERRSDVVADE